MSAELLPVSNDIQDRVLAYLVADADLDGVATTTLRELSDAAGIGRITAFRAIHHLENRGRLRIVGRGSHNLEIRVPDEALS